MIVKFKLTGVMRVIDMLTGKAIHNAEVKLDTKSDNILNKGDGYFVLVNHSDNLIKLRVYAKGYKEKNFIFENTDNNYFILALEKINQDIIPIKANFNSKSNIDGLIYYGLVRNVLEEKIIKETSNNLEIKSGNINTMALIYRDVLIENNYDIYKIVSYNITKGSYILNKPLENKVSLGGIITPLNRVKALNNSFSFNILKSSYNNGKNKIIKAYYNKCIYLGNIENKNDSFEVNLRECEKI